MTDWYCYTGGLNNTKRQIEKADIRKSLEWYRQQTGHDAKVIRLHPKVTHLADGLPDVIQVIPWSGTAAWSIDMAETMPVPIKDIIGDYQPIRTAPQQREACNTTEKVSEGGKANVTAQNNTTDDIIKRLAGEGLSSRQIAEQLSMFGIPVSHMTVARHMKKVG